MNPFCQIEYISSESDVGTLRQPCRYHLHYPVRYRTLSAMDSVNHTSVMYLPRTKAAPDAPFGAARTWGRFRLGKAPSLLLADLMKNNEKWMELCALAAKEQDPAKLVTFAPSNRFRFVFGNPPKAFDPNSKQDSTLRSKNVPPSPALLSDLQS